MKYLFFPFVACLLLFSFQPTVLHAQNLQRDVMSQLDTGAQAAELGSPRDPRLVIAGVIKVALTLIGTMMLILIVVSGYRYLTAGGNEERAKKATSTITASVIGLIIILLAYSITLFISRGIQAAVFGS